MSFRPDSFRDNQCVVTRAGRDIQHPATLHHASHVKHPLGRWSKPLAQKHSPVIPSLRRSLPLLPSRFFELHRIENSCGHTRYAPILRDCYYLTFPNSQQPRTTFPLPRLELEGIPTAKKPRKQSQNTRKTSENC